MCEVAPLALQGGLDRDAQGLRVGLDRQTAHADVGRGDSKDLVSVDPHCELAAGVVGASGGSRVDRHQRRRVGILNERVEERLGSLGAVSSGRGSVGRSDVEDLLAPDRDRGRRGNRGFGLGGVERE